MLRLALIGATGRMGRSIVRAAHASDAGGALRVAAAVASHDSRELGRDAGELAGVPSLGVPISADLEAALGRSDVAVDFSSPAATPQHLEAAVAARKPLLIGTTGYGTALEHAIDRAARDIAVLIAPNTSLGVALLLRLVGIVARTLPPGFDAAIHEAHHRHKRDAPSGTALAIAAAIAGGRGGAPAPITSVRAGDIVGDHTVLFAAPGEQLMLTHRATDRAVFAQGALRAAEWLSRQAPGRYCMEAVLGSGMESKIY